METREERHAFSSHLDRASAAVIFLTVSLFGGALVVKGLTHDLFLETGILMEEHTRRLEERIDDVVRIMRAQAHEHPGQFGSPT